MNIQKPLDKPPLRKLAHINPNEEDLEKYREMGKPYKAEGLISGTHISCAMALNPKAKASCRKDHEENGELMYTDRVCVKALPKLPTEFAKESTDHRHPFAKAFVRSVFNQMLKNTSRLTETEDNAPIWPQVVTGTMLVYDPVSYTVTVGSKGNNPAYALFRDCNGKCAAVKITWPDMKFETDEETGGKSGRLTKAINRKHADPNKNKPTKGRYIIENKDEKSGGHNGELTVIRLNSLKAQATAACGLDRKGPITVSLLCASGSMEEPRQVHGNEDDELDMESGDRITVRHKSEERISRFFNRAAKPKALAEVFAQQALNKEVSVRKNSKIKLRHNDAHVSIVALEDLKQANPDEEKTPIAVGLFHGTGEGVLPVAGGFNQLQDNLEEAGLTKLALAVEGFFDKKDSKYIKRKSDDTGKSNDTGQLTLTGSDLEQAACNTFSSCMEAEKLEEICREIRVRLGHDLFLDGRHGNGRPRSP